MSRITARTAMLPNPPQDDRDHPEFPAFPPQAISLSEKLTDEPEETIFMRLSGVKEMTGLSKSCLYLLIREKSFPAPVRIGNRAVAWVRSEVRQWALERIEAPR